jgi:hypothetical protein
MFPWKTVGMHDPSSSSPATCVPGTDDCQRTHHTGVTGPVRMTSCSTKCSSAPLRSSNCPSGGPWRMRGWSSCMNLRQLPVSMWLQPKTWWAEFPLSCCFWQETRPQQSLMSTVSARIQASRWGAPMQQRWMEGAAAMSMRSTRGCGSLGAESHAWEVLRFGRLPIGSSLRTLSGRSVRQRLVGVARRIEPDGKLKCVWYMFVPFITSIDLACTEYIPSTNQVYKPTGQHRIF